MKREDVPKLNMEGMLCEEASIHSREKFIACGCRAAALVWHDRDQKAYAMCHACVGHNVRNRGGILLGVAREVGK